MALIANQLSALNVAKIVVVDVSDDYRLMQPPLPSSWYPVVCELCVPAYDLDGWLGRGAIAEGFLYDWHESPVENGEPYYVGVVDARLARA